MENTPTALFVGKSGSGKSSGGNRFLTGRPRPQGGFKAAGGEDPVTPKCESKSVASTPDAGPLRVIDTPGIPGPRGQTMEFFNDIVRTVRSSGGLNALFVVAHYNADRHHIQEDCQTLSMILRQLGRLPCLKILLCRVAIEDGLTEQQQEEDMKGARTWASTIVRKAGAGTATKVVFLLQNSSQGSQIRELRRMVYEARKVRILHSDLRTYDELEENEKQLAALERRERELKVEKSRLECDKGRMEPRSRVLAAKLSKAKSSGSFMSGAFIAGGMVTDVLTCFFTLGSFTFSGAVAGEAAQRVYRKFATKRCNRKIKAHDTIRNGIDAKVQQIDKELQTGTIKLALQRDVKTLNELRELKNVTA